MREASTKQFVSSTNLRAPLAMPQSMRESFFACLKNVVPFLLWLVIYFVAAIVASIPLGLGWIVLGPLLLLTLYTSYKDIFA